MNKNKPAKEFLEDNYIIMKKNTTAKEFLEDNCIDLNTTSIFTVIDGYVRQPDLCILLENYAEIKVKEYMQMQYDINKFLSLNKI